MEFKNLSTERFRLRMRPHALEIYRAQFPQSHLEDLRENGVGVHILDREFAIDSLIRFKGMSYITLQEKYRRVYRDRDGKISWDFTQEYMNAVGTEHEGPGEWFKLAAQLYFYGWASLDESCFAAWAILDVAAYKMLIEEAGGLEKIGTLEQNHRFGSASFYAIPIVRLKPVCVTVSEFFWEIVEGE